MFENLSEKLQNTLYKIKNKGKLSEKDINDAMKEIKFSLLDADVNYKVVKEFIADVKQKALGSDVMQSLTPGQQVVKIVFNSLTDLLGEKESRISYNTAGITRVMLCGLQGAGKTTACAKLAALMKKEGKKAFLVAADIYRPAAADQLQILGNQIGVSVYREDNTDVLTVTKNGLRKAENEFADVVIIDTAGRLHVDSDMMTELVSLQNEIKPDEVLLVLDSMTGQDAVNIAESFKDSLSITGMILTKIDGDARGGAALSLRTVINKPVKYISTGEKTDSIELFYPERMASRILGKGDVLTLIEKVQKAVDLETAVKMHQKFKKSEFTFEDFLLQIEQMQNLGPLDSIIEMLPGANKKQFKNIKVDEKEILHMKAVIQSMTKKERINPSIINGSRKKRIN